MVEYWPQKRSMSSFSEMPVISCSSGLTWVRNSDLKALRQGWLGDSGRDSKSRVCQENIDGQDIERVKNILVAIQIQLGKYADEKYYI